MKHIYILLIFALFFTSCKKTTKNTNGKLQVVTTTTMISDMVKTVGGNAIEVKGLMGSGVDPHLYKASEGDVSKLSNADIIFYNGLHLEGKLEDVFEKMRHLGKQTVAIGESIDKSDLIASENFASNYDPHIWFNIKYWEKCTEIVTKSLVKLNPENTAVFNKNAAAYISKLKQLYAEVTEEVKALPKEKRILITAHDAFNYFGQAYNFEVIGLQGLSTATEAGVKDVQNIANLIIKYKVKAIFIETSVPKRTIEALQASVKAKGHEVKIGGELFSDALGNPNTAEGTYIGMYKHNVSIIVNALK